jgi:inner membrane transporter RhtA
MSQRRRQMAGVSTQLATQVSINFGSALAGLLIPIVGTLAVVAARQAVIAATVIPIARPKLRALGFRALIPAIALGLVLVIMNLSFYESVSRLGLGIAAPIEFLGPLALAIAASRRVLDLACAIAAGVGVFLLVGETGEFDVLGVALALTAAAAWAAYILLTRVVAERLHGLQGLAVASMVSLAVLTPIALLFVDFSTFTWPVIGLLVLGGVLASAVPYSLDTFILRRITPRVYAIITSFGPVIAAFWGWILLDEVFTPLQVGAILLICAAAALAIATQKEPVAELAPEFTAITTASIPTASIPTASVQTASTPTASIPTASTPTQGTSRAE